MARNREITRNYLQSFKEQSSALRSETQATTQGRTSSHEQVINTADSMQQTTMLSKQGGAGAGSSSAMESELKSLQSKILDLENKLNFTHHDDANSSNPNVDEEILKNGITLPNDPFKSIDEREEFAKDKALRKGSVGGNSTDKAKKALHNNFTKKLHGSDQAEVQ